MSAKPILGRYEIVAELGSGGWASVYVARVLDAIGEERRVALKVLHPHLARMPENVSSFLDEARVTSRLRHPHVVSTLDVGATRDGTYYLALDLVRGLALTTLVDRVGTRLPLRVALRIVLDALDALAYVHDACDEWGRPLSIVHRDLTPRNLLVGADGMTRVSDFGIAGARLRAVQTASGVVRGTIGYLAPEQALAEGTDRRTDLFSLGVVLWELLVGRRLYAAETDAAALLEVVSRDAPLPSTVDPALARVDAMLSRALQRDRSLRFETAAAMADALRELGETHHGVAGRDEVAALVQAHAGADLTRFTHTGVRAPVVPSQREISTASRGAMPLVGRHDEIARVLELVTGGARAITLTGMGGVGKTRLLREIELARSATEMRVPSVWIDLADAADLEPRIAASLGAPNMRAVPDLLASRGPLLLLLDNLERLAAMAAEPLQALLDATPELQIVSTSRVEIGLTEEQVIEVLPLPLPELDRPLGESAAGQLLVELLDRRGLAVTEEPVLAAIVRKVGGIPLAIELVAGRLDTLAPGEVLARLDRQLALLARPDHQHRRWSTMEACVDWSWSLLTPHEQEALGCCAVFEGTFRASWVEATVRLDAWQNAPHTLDVLAALRAKSLVQRRARQTDAHLFEIAPPVRELALDRLARRGGHDAALHAHAAAFVAMSRDGWHDAIDVASPASPVLATASHEIATVVVRAIEGAVRITADDFAALYAAIGATIEHLRDGHRLAPLLDASIERVLEAEDATAAMALSAITRIASAFLRAPLAMRASELAVERGRRADARTFAEASRAFAYAMGSARRDSEGIESTLEAALPAVRAAGDLPSEARLLCELADLARWRLDARTSVALFDLVLDGLGPDRAIVGDAARMRSMQAEALLALGEVARARDAIDRVLATPNVPATLAVVTRARASVLEIMQDRPDAALTTALGCVRDPAAFPLVTRRARMYAALACIASGRAPDAWEHLTHAARGAPPHEHALVDAIAVLAHLQAGDVAAGREKAAAAREVIRADVRPAVHAAVESALDIALLSTRPEPPRNLLRSLDALLERPFGVTGAASHHIVVRAVAHVVRAALMARDAADAGPRATPGSLLVARDGHWLITPEGEWVDCARRPMIGTLVAALAARHGEWTEMSALLAVLWPGDRSPRATLRNRLHVLVATAKKLGLSGHLESRSGAYRLASSLPIEWWDDPR